VVSTPPFATGCALVERGNPIDFTILDTKVQFYIAMRWLLKKILAPTVTLLE
jgi:hypothetical protein